jgi:ribosomal protein S18 acetylase RimI-like enzyme
MAHPSATVIRGYTPADWPQVCRVHDLARVLELERGGVDARAFRPMEEAAERDEFFLSETLVACVEDRVVGFVSWHGPYITWLYVDPGYHRRGIGSRLVHEALPRIGPEAWTITLEGNDAAVTLFREAGMEIVQARSSHCEGYPSTALRLALPTSRMRDPAARRQ